MGMYQILCSKYLIECDKYDVMNWYKQGQKSLNEKIKKNHTIPEQNNIKNCKNYVN